MIKKLSDSAVILAFITAFFYCVGTAGNRGYYRVFKLDPDVLDLGFHNILYSGLLLAFVPLFKIIFISLLVFFIVSSLIVPAYFDGLVNNFKVRRRNVRWKRKFFGNRDDYELEKKLKSITKDLAVFTVLMIAFICFLAYIEKGQHEKANRIVSDNEVQAKLTIRLEGEAKDMIFIACGSRNCAGLELPGRRIRYFSQDKGFSYPLGD